jgi:hypothetical protein
LDNSLNAWSDGKYVAVSSRLMSEVADDSELAFVIAHEMAHNILQHRKRLAGQSALFAELGIGSGKVKATEIEADSYAIKLMAKAGYDLRGAPRFLTSSSKDRWMDLPITHPGIKRRIQIVDAAIEELRLAQADGPPSAISGSELPPVRNSWAGALYFGPGMSQRLIEQPMYELTRTTRMEASPLRLVEDAYRSPRTILSGGFDIMPAMLRGELSVLAPRRLPVADVTVALGGSLAMELVSQNRARRDWRVRKLQLRDHDLIGAGTSPMRSNRSGSLSSVLLTGGSSCG